MNNNIKLFPRRQRYRFCGFLILIFPFTIEYGLVGTPEYVGDDGIVDFFH